MTPRPGGRRWFGRSLGAGALCALLAALLGAAPAHGQRFPEPPPIEAGLAPTPDRPYAPGVDVLRYDVELGVSDRADWFAGRAGIRVRATVPGATLPLDLTGLAVDEVLLDGRTADASYSGGHLLVALAGVEAGAEATVTVAYRGTPDDGLFLGPHVHGAPSAFADNWPNRTRFWMPTVDHPSDKAFVRFTVHAPAAWKVVANGYLTADPSDTPADALGPADGPRRTWIWDTVRPIPTYTMVVGAADMVVESIGRAACGLAPASQEADGCVDVTWWAFPEDVGNARRIFARAADMTDYYSRLIGPFPYEKLANVQSGTRFGGMENSSAIFYTGQGLATGTLSEGTVAHEIAHQWFGDSVTEALWSHLWLSEGFATYFGALYFEEAEGVADFRRRMEENRQRYLASDDAARPVVAYYPQLFDLLNRNSYQKGGWVLHMLRGVMGDEPFFKGIRRYYERFAHGTALTADFQAVMEEVHEHSLEWFFQQWIFEPGYPEFEVGHRWVPEDGVVEITVRQTQPATWPRFRVPLVLAVQDGPGPPGRYEVVIDAEDSTFRFPRERAPDGVVLDPDGWVLKGDVRYR